MKTYTQPNLATARAFYKQQHVSRKPTYKRCKDATLLLLCMVTLGSITGCATSLRERKLQCVERFLDKSVDALKSRDVCQWAYERN